MQEEIHLNLIGNGEMKMRRIVKKLPLPIVGLMLALAATGNLVLSYGPMYRNIFGILSEIILVLVLLKIIIYPKEVVEGLANPVIASVFPTLSMGIMILATYIKPVASSLGFSMWIVGLILHAVLIIYFTKSYILNFDIKKVFPSWFIVYVGIVVGSVTAPIFNMIKIGQVLFWFGLASYLILLPVVLKRTFKVKEIPEPALPTIVILSAPVSLCLAGYINSFPEKNMYLLWILVGLSQLTLLYILTQLPKLFKLKFYPSYSAFTFPIVISALSLKLTNGFLTKIEKPVAILKYLVKFEEALAIGIVLYVLFRYISFLLVNKETVKPIIQKEKQ